MKKICVFLATLLISCNNEFASLSNALNFAGKNKAELIEVLRYYEDSPEKLEAAKYLIKNMPYNYSIKSPVIDSAKQFLLTVYKTQKISSIDKYRDIWVDSWQQFTPIYDSHIITSDYLINHIDKMFELKSLPWNRNLSFDDFCTYLLPYIVGNEPLEDWVDSYRNYFKSESELFNNDVVYNANIILQRINKEFIYTTFYELPDLGASFFLENKLGSCRESTAFTVYAMRSLGIPCAIDMYVQSPTFRMGHSWNVLKCEDDLIIPFWLDKPEIVRGAKVDRKCGKVYRSLYSVNNNVGSIEGKYFPIKSRISKFKDVTNEYFGDNSVIIENIGDKSDVIYLGLFSSERYVPIDIAYQESKNAIFNNLETDVIYQIFTIDNNGHTHFCNYPFIYNDNNVHYFMPDTTMLTPITLKRKYPLRKSYKDEMNIFQNARIYGSKYWKVRDLDSIFHVENPIYHGTNVFKIESERLLKLIEIRYTPLETSELGQVPIAELEFYSKGQKIEYRMFPRDYADVTNIKDDNPISLTEFEVCSEEQKIDYQMFPWNYADVTKIRDGNPLTIKYRGGGGTIKVDLGNPTKLDSILFTPKNDDNYINKGEEYELLYHAGTEGWVSIFNSIATQNDSIVSDVPKGALLLLRNHTKGVEEQVFYETNGHQVFPPKLQ